MEKIISEFNKLKGLGPKSRENLEKIGICSVEELERADPYEIYAKLCGSMKGVSVNFLYAIIGAQERLDWREVARTRKTEILMRLDDLGLAPKK